MIAKFSKFFSVSILEVLRMPNNVFHRFYKYIAVIENQDRMVLNDIASYPHLQPSKRNELHDKIYKLAYPDELDNREVLTTDQLMIKLNRGF